MYGALVWLLSARLAGWARVAGEVLRVRVDGLAGRQGNVSSHLVGPFPVFLIFGGHFFGSAMNLYREMPI